MTDSDPHDEASGPPDDDAENNRLEDIVKTNTEAFRKAASKHTNWARAASANKDLGKLLSQTANISSGLLNAQIQDISRRAIAQTGISAIRPRDIDLGINTNFFSDYVQSILGKQLQGITAGLDPVKFSGLGLSTPAAAPQASILPNLRLIQRIADKLNTPAATSATQQLITGEKGPKYRSNKRVWHYTNAYALNKILIQHHLWASNPKHLNDSIELTHGIELIEYAAKRAIDRQVLHQKRHEKILNRVLDRTYIDEAIHEIYYISASAQPDSLTLWRNYSKNDGFAIGLQPGRGLSPGGIIIDQETENADSDLPAIADWYKVEYSDRRKNSLADKFITSALEDIDSATRDDEDLVVEELRKHLIVIASTMKHSAFSDEREVRWITTNWLPIDLVRYEITQRGFVPVLHVKAVGDEQSDALLPITGVRCSPTNPSTITRTIQGLLKQRGYTKAADDVSQSSMPFNG